MPDDIMQFLYKHKSRERFFDAVASALLKGAGEKFAKLAQLSREMREKRYRTSYLRHGCSHLLLLVQRGFLNTHWSKLISILYVNK